MQKPITYLLWVFFAGNSLHPGKLHFYLILQKYWYILLKVSSICNSILCALVVMNEFYCSIRQVIVSNLINHSEHHFLITVYTTQFVALFIGGSHLEKKQSCNAYLSQSTRGLRSLLRKHVSCLFWFQYPQEWFPMFCFLGYDYHTL